MRRMSAHDPDGPLAVLSRWQAAGAVWRVLGRDRTHVTIGLFTCDGGEEVSRFTSSDIALRGFVDAHPESPTSDDGRP
jgi:hypothetical protein